MFAATLWLWNTFINCLYSSSRIISHPVASNSIDFIFSIFPLLFTLQNHSYKFIKDCKSHIVGHCDKFRNNLCSRKSLYCRDPFYIWIPRNMRKKFFLIFPKEYGTTSGIFQAWSNWVKYSQAIDFNFKILYLKHAEC